MNRKLASQIVAWAILTVTTLISVVYLFLPVEAQSRFYSQSHSRVETPSALPLFETQRAGRMRPLTTVEEPVQVSGQALRIERVYIHAEIDPVSGNEIISRVTAMVQVGAMITVVQETGNVFEFQPVAVPGVVEFVDIPVTDLKVRIQDALADLHEVIYNEWAKTNSRVIRQATP